MTAAAGMVFSLPAVRTANLGTATPLDTTGYGNIIGLLLELRVSCNATGGAPGWAQWTVNGTVVLRVTASAPGVAYDTGDVRTFVFVPPNLLDGSEDIVGTALRGSTTWYSSTLLYLG